MLHAVIMAGGSGTRFWPASRKMQPKQLLALTGDRTMIQSTLDRLGDLIPAQQRWIITNKLLVDAVRQQLPDIPPANIVGEPCKRDTAPCVGLAAAMIMRCDADGTMLVMPSDHVIASVEKFQAAVLVGKRLIDEDPTRIVTFGVKPSYPAESFGYIQRDERKPIAADDLAAFKVQQFREKPDQTTARRYVDSGNYYWNSGIFLWRASTIFEALKKRVPEMAQHLGEIADAVDTERFDEILQAEFTAIQGTSIDYAVMEDYDNVVVIQATFPWDDVGSWQALSRLHDPDTSGNTVLGSHVGIDTSGSIVVSQPGHTIVTIDVQDLIVVQTDDATLVAPKHAEERVREAVTALQQRGMTEKL